MTYNEALKEWRDNVADDVKRRNPEVFGSLQKSTSEGVKTEPKVPAESKYHNQRTEYNGRTYDSKKEVAKAQELDLLVKAGELDFWLYHVRFPLPGGVIYESDFTTYRNINFGEDKYSLWGIEVIETKGFKTEAWIIKLKLFKVTYPNVKLTVI